jgi:ComF family protein
LPRRRVVEIGVRCDRSFAVGHATSILSTVRFAPWFAAAHALARTLPSVCVVCRDWSTRALCTDCLQRFAPYQPRCARCARSTAVDLPRCGECMSQASAFDRCIAGADYAAPWDWLITAFKFHQRVELAGALSLLIERGVRTAPRDDAGNRPGLLLPVPLSRERMRERGYNQAWELARRLARRLQIDADPTVLQRSRDTPHQIGMTRREREQNLRDAFWVEPRAQPTLRGRHVALVDDVLTTGATAHAAASALMRAGAVGVEVWVAARTPLGQ